MKNPIETVLKYLGAAFIAIIGIGCLAWMAVLFVGPPIAALIALLHAVL